MLFFVGGSWDAECISLVSDSGVRMPIACVLS